MVAMCSLLGGNWIFFELLLLFSAHSTCPYYYYTLFLGSESCLHVCLQSSCALYLLTYFTKAKFWFFFVHTRHMLFSILMLLISLKCEFRSAHTRHVQATLLWSLLGLKVIFLFANTRHILSGFLKSFIRLYFFFRSLSVTATSALLVFLVYWHSQILMIFLVSLFSFLLYDYLEDTGGLLDLLGRSPRNEDVVGFSYWAANLRRYCALWYICAHIGYVASHSSRELAMKGDGS